MRESVIEAAVAMLDRQIIGSEPHIPRPRNRVDESAKVRVEHLEEAQQRRIHRRDILKRAFLDASQT
jgi:hypothetical protein